jgi:serine protease Do
MEKATMRKMHIGIVAMFLASLMALSGCLAPQFEDVMTLQSTTVTPTTLPVADEGVASTAGAVESLEETLEDIYSQVNPSVVNIQVLQTASVGSSAIPEIPGYPFSPNMPVTPEPRTGLGSGFVWDKEGRIITNDHVVANANSIRVTFSDGATVPATMLASDPDSDLAVIEVDMPADRLHPVEMADSIQVRVGELVVAIGNPFGLEGTMTMGIVSALGRSLPVQTDVFAGTTYSIPDIIQTDAPINPGNSGGVLVDDTGRVIGVTAAIESTVGANVGIGFAIPSVIVQKVVPALIEFGSYQHPWLGISGITLSPELVKAMGLEADQQGVLVIDITPDSPADEAGLLPSDQQVEIQGMEAPVGGDVIAAVDGQPVRQFHDLIAYLARHTEVGQEIALQVVRDDGEQTLNLTLGARPSAERAEREGEIGAYLGIIGVTLTPEIGQSMDLSPSQKGVLIQQVQDESPADQAGLRGGQEFIIIEGQQLLIGGDIIVAMDAQPIANFEDLRAFMQEAEVGQIVTVILLRDGERGEVDVTLGEPPSSTL